MKERKDDYLNRRKHLENKNGEELKKYFYELSEKVVSELVDLGHDYTSKSIERSVLLRMGFSSIEAKSIVDILGDNDLLRKGAGHCVYKVSLIKKKPIRLSGTEIAAGNHIEFLKKEFKIYE